VDVPDLGTVASATLVMTTTPAPPRPACFCRGCSPTTWGVSARLDRGDHHGAPALASAGRSTWAKR